MRYKVYNVTFKEAANQDPLNYHELAMGELDDNEVEEIEFAFYTKKTPEQFLEDGGE